MTPAPTFRACRIKGRQELRLMLAALAALSTK